MTRRSEFWQGCPINKSGLLRAFASSFLRVDNVGPEMDGLYQTQKRQSREDERAFEAVPF
jgi:hypothetical protein